jgi:hypothetical protein
LEAYYSFVKKIISAFNKVGLDYAFTGALATSFYGVHRTTSDVDVISPKISVWSSQPKLTACEKSKTYSGRERRDHQFALG